MSKARNRDAIDGLNLSRSEMEILIYEANLSEEDTFIAQRRYISGIPNIEIAGEMSDKFGREINRKTVSARLRIIAGKMSGAYRKIENQL